MTKITRVSRKILYILYQPYKWLFFIPFAAINTLFFGIVAVLVSTLVNQRIGSFFGGVIWSRLNTILTPVFVGVSGRNNIRKGASYVVISNHQSIYDIFLIYGWLGIDIKWIMKKELAKIPGVGFGSRKVGHIFLDRSNSRVALESLNEAKKKLVNGISVVIFPEGTRSKTGQMGPFKKGAFKLALDLGLPLLPVSISGTKDILPTGSLNIFPGKVRMIIHEPIGINNYSEETLKDLMARSMQVIASGLPNYRNS
ncbi:MAG TPA: lysophospholipid acyltransferase family protein [Bacteroidales bacterium]|nr:lysophospholipid acyltransferase family protein [Bacteroidales bacterium]